MSAGTDLGNQRILVTGAAGFIGAFLSRYLLNTTECQVLGIDNLNDYYDVELKHQRLALIAGEPGARERFRFERIDLVNSAEVERVFRDFRPHQVVNLAAQAGVRYSVDKPQAYIDSNVTGFLNILEACRRHPVDHLVYASSSSVYGNSAKTPYSEADLTDSPASLYAATKKANELMATAYFDLFGIKSTGLRFFTVYGPMGRPDMAYFKFAEKIRKGEAIEIYNFGDLRRDFTYIDDIVAGIASVLGAGAPSRPRVYNIGNSDPVGLLEFVETLEKALMEANLIQSPPEHVLLPMQIGDVYETYADVSALETEFGFRPTTPLALGLRAFVKWYVDYSASATDGMRDGNRGKEVMVP